MWPCAATCPAQLAAPTRYFSVWASQDAVVRPYVQCILKSCLQVAAHAHPLADCHSMLGRRTARDMSAWSQAVHDYGSLLLCGFIASLKPTSLAENGELTQTRSKEPRCAGAVDDVRTVQRLLSVLHCFCSSWYSFPSACRAKWSQALQRTSRVRCSGWAAMRCPCAIRLAPAHPPP